MNLHELIDRLHKEHTLTKEEFITLIKERNEESASYLASLAREEAVNLSLIHIYIIHIHWTCPIFHLCNIYEIHNVLNLLFLFLF